MPKTQDQIINEILNVQTVSAISKVLKKKDTDLDSISNAISLNQNLIAQLQAAKNDLIKQGSANKKIDELIIECEKDAKTLNKYFQKAMKDPINANVYNAQLNAQIKSNVVKPKTQEVKLKTEDVLKELLPNDSINVSQGFHNNTKIHFNDARLFNAVVNSKLKSTIQMSTKDLYPDNKNSFNANDITVIKADILSNFTKSIMDDVDKIQKNYKSTLVENYILSVGLDNIKKMNFSTIESACAASNMLTELREQISDAKDQMERNKQKALGSPAIPTQQDIEKTAAKRGQEYKLPPLPKSPPTTPGDLSPLMSELLKEIDEQEKSANSPSIKPGKKS